MSIDTIFQILILIFSVIIHEVSHGAMAYYLGDMTAKMQGRLTLNPLPHIDPVGSVILPALMALSNSPILFGWAKPVPYNPYNLRKGGKWGELLVALAGPASNFMLAILFIVILRIGIVPLDAYRIVQAGIYINILLAVFNLIPIPPLDGSKVLPGLLPRVLAIKYGQLTSYLNSNPFIGFGLVLVLLMMFGKYLHEFIFYIINILLNIGA